LIPPYRVITVDNQYNVPQRYTVPVSRPSQNARDSDMERLSAISSGVSAIHAKAG
jgi:hypothetical protein